MNPDQPSREQIEARITALLLGELPAAEAELLRWTISQDPDLQKLHDQLKLTIGFVREAMKNPAGAPVERDAPLKLAEERRQTLLAHFKTARSQPQLPQESKSVWLRRIDIFPKKISRLVEALAVIAIFAVLASMLLPVVSGSKERAQRVTASFNEASQPTLGVKMQQFTPAAANRWKMEQGKPLNGAPGIAGAEQLVTQNMSISSITPTPAPIALPNTESSPVELGDNAGTVFSQNVVGYVNAGKGRYQDSANQLAFGTDSVSGSAGSSPERQPVPNSEASFTFTASSQSASPFANRLQSQSAGTETASVAEQPSSPAVTAMPPQLPEQIPSVPAGGTYYVADRGGERFSTGITSFGGGGGIGGIAGTGAVPVMNDQPALAWSANDMNLQAQSKSLSDNKKVLNGPINGIFRNGLQSGQAYANTAPNPNVTAFNFSDFVTNGVVTDGDRNLGLLNVNKDQSALTTREEQVYVYNLHNANPNDVAAALQDQFGLASRSADRESQNASAVSGTSDGLKPIAQPPALAPLPPGESQNANTVAENSDNLRDGSIDKLKNQYAEEGAQIQSMQGEVEQLRKKEHIRDADPMAQAPSPILSAAQIQSLNEKLVEQKALAIKLGKELDEFQTIQATNPTDRVSGTIYGLQAQLAATEAQVAGFTNQLNEIEGENQNALEKDRPYWNARARLQNEQDLHRLLGEKIEADEADAQVPKSALVTVISPAMPGQSQSLWQRMTGTVESKARVQIQPDVTSVTPIECAPYDPYFMETEVKSIQSDAVLGKVVDSLKLGDSEKLSRIDAIARLRSQLDLESDRNTKLIEIGVKSDKPDEAAEIANAVAETYKQYALETHSNTMVSGIERLKQKYAEEDRQIRDLQTKVQQNEPPVSASHAAGQQYAQNGRTLEKSPITQTPRSVKEADRPLTPPRASLPIPQPEIQTRDNAFSTFSLNVSDVSFKLAMASLEKGRMPDPGSIRSEEFIDAFDYHDPEPLQGEPLAFVSEQASDPFAQERDLLRFSVKAAASGRQDGRALNLVLLLDTSGSMERADRVAIIREALRVLSAQLQPHDVISVVTFARTARLWADGVPGDQAGATLDKVGSITPEGGTNLEEAMRLAYETALRHFIAGGMNRVVMLTDGAANLGDVDPKTLTQNVDAERRQGIALDCFGIGWDDYNDDLLEQLSSNGDGRYAFINSPDEAATEFAAKLAGALQVAAEDVKVQVEFNPKRVTAWRQIGYAKHQLTKQQFRDNSVAAGAIAAREAGNALYAVETKPDGEGPIATVHVRYRVPGTQDVHERSWLVDYTGAAPELAQSSPAMRLAVTAAEISEWMAESPFAQDVTPDELLNYLSGVPQYYGADERPKQLETMIREAKSVSGK